MRCPEAAGSSRARIRKGRRSASSDRGRAETMAEYTFFTNPMSRGQIARWALHEAGAEYDQVLVDWTRKPAEFLAANPMGKVPTIIHHALGGDRVIAEAAAICAYLADEHPLAELAPRETERADYYRWMVF